MGYLRPFGRHIKKGQGFGTNAWVGPNPGGGHNGDDWLTWTGEPVRAAGDGEVVFAGQFDSTWADNFGWNLNYGGYMVVINLDGQYAPYVEYGHLSELKVKTGQRVKRGQIIALTGNTDGGTNVSSGPHCHVGVLPWNYDLNTNTYGRVNPDLYLTDYWDDSQIAPQGDFTPIETQEDDELSKEQYDEINRKLDAIIGTSHRSAEIGNAFEDSGTRANVNLILRLIMALDARFRYLKREGDDTLYDLQGGKLRGITLAEWQASGGLEPVKVEADVIDALLEVQK